MKTYTITSAKGRATNVTIDQATEWLLETLPAFPAIEAPGGGEEWPIDLSGIDETTEGGRAYRLVRRAILRAAYRMAKDEQAKAEARSDVEGAEAAVEAGRVRHLLFVASTEID